MHLDDDELTHLAFIINDYVRLQKDRGLDTVADCGCCLRGTDAIGALNLLAMVDFDKIDRDNKELYYSQYPKGSEEREPIGPPEWE